MKFINILRLMILLQVSLFVSCSSFSPVQTSAPASATTEQNLSPLETQLLVLKAQPNLYKSAIQQPPPAQDRREFSQALGLIKQAKLAEAKVMLLRLSERQPNLSGVWLQLALVNKAQDQDPKAYLQNAIAVNPLNYFAHNEMALLLRQEGQFQQALSHYDSALKSWPAFPQAYLNRAILKDLYLGDKPQALADYQVYQGLLTKDSRQLKGWIMDLQRQIKTSQNALNQER